LTHTSKLPIIVGLDALGGDAGVAARLASTLCPRVTGYKVGLPNILASPEVGPAVRRACPTALLIADLKLADISDTMVRVAASARGWADAVIAHAFPGYEGALDGLSRALHSWGVRLAVVVAMSNPGAAETMDPLLPRLVGVARRARAWGLVAPATRPHAVAEARRLYPEAYIMSPGVGAQGAPPGSALAAGADAEIVGRAITLAGDPLEALAAVAAGLEEGWVRGRRDPRG